MSGSAQPAAGKRFEYKVRDVLKANGYWVMRSPASRSVVDLLGLKRGQILFVQCKVNGRLDPAEWNALFEAAQQAGAIPVMVERPAPGKFAWWKLDAPKWPDSGTRRQPMTPFLIDYAAV